MRAAAPRPRALIAAVILVLAMAAPVAAVDRYTTFGVSSLPISKSTTIDTACFDVTYTVNFKNSSSTDGTVYVNYILARYNSATYQGAMDVYDANGNRYHWAGASFQNVGTSRQWTLNRTLRLGSGKQFVIITYLFNGACEFPLTWTLRQG